MSDEKKPPESGGGPLAAGTGGEIRLPDDYDPFEELADKTPAGPPDVPLHDEYDPFEEIAERAAAGAAAENPLAGETAGAEDLAAALADGAVTGTEDPPAAPASDGTPAEDPFAALANETDGTPAAEAPTDWQAMFDDVAAGAAAQADAAPDEPAADYDPFAGRANTIAPVAEPEASMASEMSDEETKELLASLDDMNLDSIGGGASGPSLDLDSMIDGDDFDIAAALGLGAPAPESDAGVALDEMDLDKQLEMLLQSDQQASENFDLMDIDVGAPAQTVYDPTVDGLGILQYVKGAYAFKDEKPKNGFFDDVTWTRIAATAVLGLSTIGVLAVMTIYAATAIQEEQNAVLALSHFTPISMPENTANSANSIFVNQTAMFRGEPLTLTRITVGGSGTLFFFEEVLDLDEYDIYLHNQARQLFAWNKFVASPDEGTVLKFGRLHHNTMFLTLTIVCRETGESVSFNYRFLSPPVLTGGVYYSMPASAARVHADEAGLMVRHARFDNAMSLIHYSIDPSHEGSGLRLAGAPQISMRDMMGAMNLRTHEPALHYFDEFGLYMGVAAFAPATSLDGTAFVTFRDAVYRYVRPSADVDVTPAELFDRNQLEFDPHSMPLGDYTLNLEAMSQQHSLVVLVVHALDARGHRVRVEPRVSLRIEMDDGEYRLVEGEARSSRIGSDILFDLGPHLSAIRLIPLSRYSLQIEYVDFMLEAATVEIPLSTTFGQPSFRRDDAEASILETFTALLSYKSGEISREGVSGLSPEMRGCEELFGIFSTDSLFERPMYAASIATGDLVTNYDYVAVVEAQWVQGRGETLDFFHETFKVRARSSDGIWSVTDVRLAANGGD